MHNWDWHRDPQNRSYLTCSLLQDWQHGFFTKLWAAPPESLVSTFDLFSTRASLEPSLPVYRLKQVHGNRVVAAADLEPVAEAANPALVEADGLVSTTAGQTVWVCTADCTPVLIGDVATGQVAAIHAGWRGTALQIVPETIAKLQAQGSRTEDLRIAMGPAIAGEVYQVSTTVAAQVGASLLDEVEAPELQDLTADAVEQILQKLQELPESPVLDDPQPGRARLDVRMVNQLQIARLGIAAEQVAIAPYCTYQTPDLFFSYRRESKKQVQWSGIVSQVR
ncbi:MAG: peptidoglycan editing factor PgeF [Elainella sp.]